MSNTGSCIADLELPESRQTRQGTVATCWRFGKCSIFAVAGNSLKHNNILKLDSANPGAEF